MKQYPVGIQPDPPDDRDILMVSLLPEVELPVKKDYRNLMGSVRDQGDEPLCGGFSSSSMKESQEWKERGKFIRFSPRHSYVMSRIVEPIKGDGTTLRALVKALHQFGICEESFWPFIPGKEGSPKPGADENAYQYRISAYARLHNFSDITRSLIANGPGLIGLHVTPEWYSIPETGIMEPLEDWVYSYGGHAVCYCGYDRENKLLLIKNSWGADWGDKGYAWIPFETVEKLWISAWSATDLIGG